MSEPTPIAEWPATVLDGLVLFLLVLLIVFDLGRSASERLTVAVGAVRLRPPTLVPLADAETATAVGLLGGALTDYLAASEQEPRS
jgi:hypothetical protein